MRIPFFFIRVFLKAFTREAVLLYSSPLVKDLFCFVYTVPRQNQTFSYYRREFCANILRGVESAAPYDIESPRLHSFCRGGV